MIIQASIIKKPRKQRLCNFCTELILIGEPSIRLYGYAFTGDTPYVIYEHLKCGAKSKSDKIAKILNEFSLDTQP